jgi:hypothetical protein
VLGIGLATAFAGCSDSEGDRSPAGDEPDGSPASGGDGANGDGSSPSGSTTSLSTGESFTNGIGNTLTVSDIALQDAVEAERRMGDGMYQKEAPEGEQFVVVTLEITNESGQTQYLTPTMEIEVEADGETHSNTAIKNEGEVYSPAEVADGESRSGWLAYSVPASLSLADVSVVHSNSVDGESWTATWSTA